MVFFRKRNPDGSVAAFKFELEINSGRFWFTFSTSSMIQLNFFPPFSLTNSIMIQVPQV
jgi:hypothetical protein